MKFAEKVQKCVSHSLIKESVNHAIKNTNSACLFWLYQPKESENIKKLRKF